jgi:hypothetical protein
MSLGTVWQCLFRRYSVFLVLIHRLGFSPVPDREFRTFCLEFGNEARFPGINRRPNPGKLSLVCGCGTVIESSSLVSGCNFPPFNR